MKKVLPLVFCLCTSSLFAQPLYNMQGRTYIKFEHIKNKDKELFIIEFDNSDKNKEFNYLTDSTKEELDKKGIMDNKLFVFKKDEIDNSIKTHLLIFGQDTMRIDVKKNGMNLWVTIKEMCFEKGTYLIDLQELYTKSSGKTEIRLYDFQYEIIIDEFPYDCICNRKED